MNKSTATLIALLGTGAVLAACNGTNNGGFPGPGPTSTPSGNCGSPPSGNQLEVLYPIPGTKKAKPNVTAIYVATKGALPPSNQFDFFLVQSNGKSTYTGTFAQVNASQIPSPSATPSYSGATYYGTAIAGPYGTTWNIGLDQSVALYWNDGGRNCIPHSLVSSFKTKKVY